MKVFTWMVLMAAAWLVACATTPSSVPTIVSSENVAKLQTRQWELKSITLDSRDIVMDMEANMTLAFAPGGKVTGYAAVNRFNGTYSFSPDGKLSWPGPGFVTTRKAGPPELMEKERAYLQALPKTERAILKGHALLLQNDGESTVLIFAEAGSPQ
jgi:heat shock protein HslJ